LARGQTQPDRFDAIEEEHEKGRGSKKKKKKKKGDKSTQRQSVAAENSCSPAQEGQEGRPTAAKRVPFYERGRVQRRGGGEVAKKTESARRGEKGVLTL